MHNPPAPQLNGLILGNSGSYISNQVFGMRLIAPMQSDSDTLIRNQVFGMRAGFWQRLVSPTGL